MKPVDHSTLRGKRVLLRTDLNLPVEQGSVQKTLRFRRYLTTIKNLAQAGAHVGILSHQGRPGRDDFLSLEQHAQLLAEELENNVQFIPGFFHDTLAETLENGTDGDIFLLENTRFLAEELENAPPEHHADNHSIKWLADHFDLFINDAFSTAHRSHSSMVGFLPHLDSFAGDIMLEEVKNCDRAIQEIQNPLLLLGGEKPGDIIPIIENLVKRASRILLGGIPGELGLIAQGHELGKKKTWIQEHGLDAEQERLKGLIQQHSNTIQLPCDLETDTGTFQPGNVPDNDMTWDIGPRTREQYANSIKKAESIVMKGPMGAFDQGHETGTRTVIDALAQSRGFTVIGGGHSSSLIERYGYSTSDFSHISIAGGAFVRYLSGEQLPVIEALKQHAQQT